MNRMLSRGRASVSRIVRSGIGRALSLVEPRIAVICYHAVQNVETDPWSLFVSVENFKSQLGLFTSYADVLSLEEVAAGITNGGLPKRGVVLTFDDGYRGATNVAAPLISSAGLTATMFITSSLIGMNSECWWDELEQLFLLPGDLPSRLEIEIGGTSVDESLDPLSSYDQSTFERHRAWSVASRALPTVRHRLFVRVYQLLKPLDSVERSFKCQELWKWAGRSPLVRTTHAMASSSDLKKLSTLPGISVGGHTFAHPILSTLPEKEQAAEIEHGKKTLEAMIGGSVRTFAYPYGGNGDFDAHTTRVVRDAGFSAACTTVPASVTPRSNVLAIPRWPAYDCDANNLAPRLKRWLST